MAPGGKQVRLILESEKPLNSPTGAGNMSLRIESHLQTGPLQKGMPFMFGSDPARIVGILHWAGFSYSRSPGIGIVFSGFALLITGCLLLVFPAGVAIAETTGDNISLRLYQNRGVQQLNAELLQAVSTIQERGTC